MGSPRQGDPVRCQNRFQSHHWTFFPGASIFISQQNNTYMGVSSQKSVPQKRGGAGHFQTEHGDGVQGMSRSGRWPYVRRLAWDRDRKARSVCHICGQQINYFLKPSSCEDAWEPDHIIPVAKAPELELDLKNIAPAHKRCNRARGDGTNGENTLGMQSRIW